MRRAASVTALILLTISASARADGLPVVGVDVGASSVAAGGVRFVALPVPHGTVVAAIAKRGGRVLRRRYIGRALGLPAVAYDGSVDGLSHDARTLVLIRPRVRFPQARTQLLVLDTGRLTIRRRIDLRGDFSFDAISPDGRTLYLVHYQSRSDPTRYEVRAFDVARGRLTPEPVVDPREPDERMGGTPVTRAASADGRWAYTLYDRPGGAPFVHALDTVSRSARCIDLPSLARWTDRSALQLRAGSALTVLADGLPVARIDLRTFSVGPPTRAAREAGGSDGFPWVLAAALLGAAVVSAGLRLRLRSPSAA